MEKSVDYSILDKVLVEDYDLIIPMYSSIHQFCIRNKIKTIGDLLRKIDNDEVNFKNKKSRDELLGFVDLVKYRHFNINLQCGELLNEVVSFVPNSNKGQFHALLDDVSYNSDFTNPLRRLGFTTKEIDQLEYIVKKSKESCVIIDIIYSYSSSLSRSFGYKGMKEILEKKLDIYKEYYSNNLKPYNSFETQKYIEIDILFRRLASLKDKRRGIDVLIEEIKNEIEKNSKFVSNDKVKKLIKKYEDK